MRRVLGWFVSLLTCGLGVASAADEPAVAGVGLVVAGANQQRRAGEDEEQALWLILRARDAQKVVKTRDFHGVTGHDNVAMPRLLPSPAAPAKP